MKGFVTNETLREIAGKISDRKAFLEKRASRTDYNTFLSHSSDDDDVLPGVIFILENHGAVVYTDNGDERLPERTSPETAKILRSTVRDCRRLVLFVTKNSKGSCWIPWELGLGDGMKGAPSVALFPSGDTWFETRWAEEEYLGLYQRIIWGTFEGKDTEEWMVLDHHKNSAIALGEWLREG
ncbi:MAG: hypothetical protein WD342_05140 [Verrucomicrobiales bacterium]